jgi:hypothetical protein
MDATLKRIAPLSGVVFVVLYVAGVLIAMKGSPDFAGDPAAIQTFFENESNRILWGACLAILSLPFWFLFLGNLRSGMAKAEGGAERLSATAFGSGVAAAATGTAGFLVGAMGAMRADDAGKIDAATATVMWDVWQVLAFTATVAVLSAFSLAVGVASLRYGAVIPKWLGVVAILLAIVYLIPPISWAALPVGLLLTLIISVLLFQQRAGEL